MYHYNDYDPNLYQDMCAIRYIIQFIYPYYVTLNILAYNMILDKYDHAKGLRKTLYLF